MAESILTLREIIAKSISTDPTLPHSVEDSGGAIRLSFPKQSETGFDIELHVSAGEICIETSTGWHKRDESEDAAAVIETMGLVRDLLTTNMRIRELRAGGRGYRWFVEAREGDAWVPESSVGLLIFNYCGRRSEACYQNDTLPPRSMHGRGETKGGVKDRAT
jgi:hypothetical protein